MQAVALRSPGGVLWGFVTTNVSTGAECAER